MAIIYNPKLTVSLTLSHVTLDVTYELQFLGYEKQPWLQFIQRIDVLGGKSIPPLIANLAYTPEKIHRHEHVSIPRHYFDLGALPVQIHCRIRVEPSPLVGAEAMTNPALVPSLAVQPYVPLKWLQRAAVAGLAAAALVVAAAAARRR